MINMAQGPNELVDAKDHRLRLLRDRQRNLQMINGACATRAVVETPDSVRHQIRTEDFRPRWVRNSGQGRG